MQDKFLSAPTARRFYSPDALSLFAFAFYQLAIPNYGEFGSALAATLDGEPRAAHDSIPMTALNLHSRVSRFGDDLTAWHRKLHQHPELSFKEEQTSAFVQRILKEYDIEFETGVGGGFGVVAEIRGDPGPMVGLRADMDALPIQEETGCPYASQNTGVMHACGHDAHTTMLLGAARTLKELAHEKQLPGSVRLIFQPAEEASNAHGKSGGRLMVEDGVLEGLSAVFAQHVSPSVEAGKMSFLPGTINASSDSFMMTVHGRAAHGAMPHRGCDAIVAAASLIQNIQQIVSRKMDPLSMGLITVGTLQAGTARNIVANQAVMTGTIRAFDESTRDLLKEELHRVCRTAEGLGARVECVVTEGYPVGFNNPEATALAEEAIRRHLGPDAVHPPLPASSGSEDFSFMTARVPGSFMRVGVKDPAWPETLNLHTPTFQIDERALPTGATALTSVAVDFLTAHRPQRAR